MRFDPLSYNPLAVGKRTVTQSGKIEVRADKAVTLFVEAYGVEAIVGTGTRVDCTVRPGTEYWVEGAANAKCFTFVPVGRDVEKSKEVFTNFDTIPAPSASEQAMLQLMRRFKLEQKAEIEKMRADNKKAGHTVRDDPERPEPDPLEEEPDETTTSPAPEPAAAADGKK